ncbi:hypothetical protein [Fusibacter sp. 3D3]|nr:hypothetical protein [Fusibacter sp. 3D3]GAU77165.1 hypothetical protein F3D3_1779 [Fusibacter sp. 3D3]
MKFDIIAIIFFFVILISIQYTLNQILLNLKDINRKLNRIHKNKME